MLDPVDAGAITRSRFFVTYRRVRGGLPMPQDTIDVFVSTDTHRIGAGVVLGMEIQWDRDVRTPAPGASLISEGAALLLAQRALALPVATRSSNADTNLAIHCVADRCGPMWRVQWLGTVTTSRTPDTAYVDAIDGDVVSLDHEKAHYTGTVDVNTNYAYDSADVGRDFSYALLWDGLGVYDNTDGVGFYDFPTSQTTGYVGLDGAGYTFQMDARHQVVQTTDVCIHVAAPNWQSFTLGGSSLIWMLPNATTHARTDFLMFHWMTYMGGVFQQFTNAADWPYTLWYQNGGGGSGHFQECDGTNEVGTLSIGAYGDEVANSILVRDVFQEEIHHSVDWCTETVGSGCGYTAISSNGARVPFIADRSHAYGGAIGSRMNQYETWVRGGAWVRERVFKGFGVAGDVFLYDDEIDGTPTTPGPGCNQNLPGGAYNCTASEACQWDSHDRPRCMKRAASLAACQAMFPSQPDIDWQNYGNDGSGGGGINICVSNDYTNGNFWLNLGAQHFSTDGYFYAFGGWYWGMRNLATTRQLTQGSDNWHHATAGWSNYYETSDVFHQMSTETFTWLDDTTDVPSHEEIIRTPRNAELTFSNGGPTGTALGFQLGLYGGTAVYDEDGFLLTTNPSQTYEINAQTTDMNVDLCARIYNWLTGALIASSAGCTDGTSNRNAMVQFTAAAATTRYEIWIYNVLAKIGSYTLKVKVVNDDYANAFNEAQMNEPLSNGVGVGATMNNSADRDLFRYDAPAGSAGTLIFSVGSFSADIDVYATSGTTPPSGSPIATGVSSTPPITVTPGTRYYAHVKYRSTTGAYTMTATHSTCSGCDDNGSLTTPIFFPSTAGGIVRNELDHSALEPGYNTLAACESGSSCDWYQMTLAANERMTATLYNVFDSLCQLELTVLPPISSAEGGQQQYFQDGNLNWHPMIIDRDGSMETNGAQLTFVAPRAGTYRLRVRGLGGAPNYFNCPRYFIAATKGAVDTNVLPPIH